MKHLTVHDAYTKMTEGHVYVDVRSIPEFESGHPAGAVNVPLLHRDERTGQMAPNREFVAVMVANFPPDARLLIGCQVGGRSAQAVQVLEAAGYRDVANVAGGFVGARDPMTGAMRAPGWVAAGLPVETDPAPECRYETLRARLTEAG
jgi:rhodanese-related sulfurtransferase